MGEALGRLGRLAGEVQGIVDELVRGLMEEGVVEGPAGATLIRRDRMEGQPEYLVRELFVAVWQARGWPLQSMGFEEWDSLVQMLLSDGESAESIGWSRTYPGRIQAECCGEGLLLRLS